MNWTFQALQEMVWKGCNPSIWAGHQGWNIQCLILFVHCLKNLVFRTPQPAPRLLGVWVPQHLPWGHISPYIQLWGPQLSWWIVGQAVAVTFAQHWCPSLITNVWGRAPHPPGLTGAAGVTGDCLQLWVKQEWEITSVNSARGEWI